MITANNGLTVATGTTSTQAITAAGLITANAGLTVTNGQTLSVGTTGTTSPLTVFGSITGNSGLIISSGTSALQAITAAGLITANTGLTVTNGQTLNVGTSGTTSPLNVYGLITGDFGLTISSGTSSLQDITAAGLITANAGLTVANGQTLNVGTSGSTSLLNIFGTMVISGLITANAGILITAGALTTANAVICRAGTASGVGTSHYRLQSSSLDRFSIGLGNTESGSNTGSDLTFYNYNDAGTYISTFLTVTRATGLATFTSGLTVSGSNLTVANSNILYTTNIDSNTGNVAVGYNTLKTASGFSPFSVYNNSTNRTILFNVSTVGTSSGSNSVSVNAPLLVNNPSTTDNLIANTSSSASIGILDAYAPNLSTTGASIFRVGVASALNNTTEFTFNYTASGSTSNSLKLGFYSNSTSQYTMTAAGVHTFLGTTLNSPAINTNGNSITAGALTTSGALKFTSGAVNTYVLQTDGVGNANWVSVASLPSPTITNTFVQSTTAQSTTSTTAVNMPTMTLTPPSGTYYVTYTGVTRISIQLLGNSTSYYQFAKNGTAVSGSLTTLVAVTSNEESVVSFSSIISCSGTDVITVQFYVAGSGPPTLLANSQKSMFALRLGA